MATKKATQNAAKIIDPGWSWDDKLPLAQAKADRQHYLCIRPSRLQLAGGKLVGKGNMKTQTRQVFRNIKAVLAAAGAKMEHIIKINTYITDGSKFMEMLEARGDIFGDNPPCQYGCCGGRPGFSGAPDRG